MTQTSYLAWLSAIAAGLSLVINRILLRLDGLHLETGTSLAWARAGAFCRNTAVAAGLLLVLTIIASMYRDKAFAPLTRRFMLLFFVSILVLSVGTILFLPQPSVSPRLILLAMGSGNILGVLVGLEALRGPGVRIMRLGISVWIAGLLASFFALVLGILLVTPGMSEDLLLARVIRHCAEFMYLSAPLAIAGPVALQCRKILPIAAGLLSGLITLGLLGWLFVGPSSEYSLLLYGALRTAWLLDGLPAAYLFVLPLLVGLSTLCAMSSDRVPRHIGLGLCLSLSAGFAPTSAAGALWIACGTLFMALGVIELRHTQSQAIPAADPGSTEEAGSA
jgi:hypothetical protein